MHSISEDVDVGECSSATKDADAASPIPCVGEDVARKESRVTIPDIHPTTPIAYIGVDVARNEGHVTIHNRHAATIISDFSVVASRDVEPVQEYHTRRPGVDVHHLALIRVARLCIQHDRACHRRLEDDAPGDAEHGAQVVGPGGKDDAADGGVGECTGQAGGGAHRRGPRRIRRRRGRWRQARRRGRRGRRRGRRGRRRRRGSPAHGAKTSIKTPRTMLIVPGWIFRICLDTILVAKVVVWLTRVPVGVVPWSAVGPPPGALAYRISRTDPGSGGLRDDGPHSLILRGAVDACEITAERLARCAPSRPRAEGWYVNEWRGTLAFNARHPVEAEEDSQPDSPSSTSRLRPSSPTPTCSLRPVSHRARTQCSKQPAHGDAIRGIQ